MKIELKEISIRDLVAGYVNNAEEGVVGFDSQLNIRPKYQREFVYKDKQQEAVMDTVKKSFPLNVMYWVENEDGTLEVLDGQQRTLSICEYVNGSFAMDFQYFHNLEADEKDQILDYKLMVYFCNGSDSEKLDWFKTINIAGEKLTNQELRNAVYTGTWLTDAKRHFSKSKCAAYNLANDYMKGVAIRQDYLETAISWISNGNIEEYMAVNQHAPNASKLWLYFQNVIAWVDSTFPEYRKEMKGVNWGELYNDHHEELLDSKELEELVVELMMDEDVTKKVGIYPYLITGNRKYLSLRAFTAKQKREAYEKQRGFCPHCGDDGEKFSESEMEADHITPWSQGGTTTADNCQMLCKHHNRTKSDK